MSVEWDVTSHVNLYAEIWLNVVNARLICRRCDCCQGSEAKSVVYVVGTGRCQTWQHVYTAVTRGRSQVIIVARKSMLDWALETQPITRLTGLKEKLMNVLSLPLHSVTSTSLSFTQNPDHCPSQKLGEVGKLEIGHRKQRQQPFYSHCTLYWG